MASCSTRHKASLADTSSAVIDSEKIYEERIVLIGAPGSPDRLSQDQLGKAAFVCALAGTYRRALTDRLLAEHHVFRDRVLLELEHPEAIKKTVAEGAGLAFLFWSSVRDDVERGVVALIEVDGMALSTPVYLNRRHGKDLSIMQESLIAHIRSSSLSMHP